MGASPGSRVWQYYWRMPEESERPMEDDGKCYEMCHNVIGTLLKCQLGVEEKGELRLLTMCTSSRYVTFW